jgi:hypothetical protein
MLTFPPEWNNIPRKKRRIPKRGKEQQQDPLEVSMYTLISYYATSRYKSSSDHI